MEEDELLSFIDSDVSFTENIAEIVGFLLLGKFLAVFWYIMPLQIRNTVSISQFC